jgi:hypothetical protein
MRHPLEFKLEKIIGIKKHAEKVRKIICKKILDSLFGPSVPQKNSNYARKNCSHNRSEQLW